MRDLRDCFLEALLAHIQAGHGLALAAYPWQCCPGAIGPGGVETPPGPTGCTCWEPVFDQVQTGPPPETVAAVALGRQDVVVRDGMCTDCAYRPGSPERSGDPRYQSAPGLLDAMAAGSRFYCHITPDGAGMRRILAWRHPGGLRIPAAVPDEYRPPIVDNVPYLADGTPAPLCAGWAARGRALAHRDARDNTRAGAR